MTSVDWSIEAGSLKMFQFVILKQHRKVLMFCWSHFLTFLMTGFVCLSFCLYYGSGDHKLLISSNFIHVLYVFTGLWRFCIATLYINRVVVNLSFGGMNMGVCKTMYLAVLIVSVLLCSSGYGIAQQNGYRYTREYLLSLQSGAVGLLDLQHIDFPVEMLPNDTQTTDLINSIIKREKEGRGVV